jgi:hypothetical protein
VKRRLFNAGVVVSLGALAAVLALWGGSYWTCRVIHWERASVERNEGMVLVDYYFSVCKGTIDVARAYYLAELDGETTMADVRRYYARVSGWSYSSFEAEHLAPDKSPAWFADEWNQWRFAGVGVYEEWHMGTRIRIVELPVWLIALGLAIMPARSAWILHRRRIARGTCPACGYDLRGTPSKTCPECGAAREVQAA